MLERGSLLEGGAYSQRGYLLRREIFREGELIKEGKLVRREAYRDGCLLKRGFYSRVGERDLLERGYDREEVF